MKFLQRFFEDLQKDFRLFLFMLVLLEIYRAAFIFFMSDYIAEESTSAQISTALWTGLRLSLKTAGFIAAISFVFVTILRFNFRLRLIIGMIFSFVFAVLFMARFPYYREFNATFGIEIIRGLHDDIFSIIAMIVQEYGFFWRFPVALILTVICIGILSRLLLLKTFQLPEFEKFSTRFIFSLGLTIFLVVFGVFVRFGGSLTYSGGISWESSTVTSDDFLNECILDDGQAMYRAYTMAKYMGEGIIAGVDENKILESAQIISGKNFVENNLTPYLEKAAGGARIEKPQHIFIILGETFMQWPMLGKYENLHVADGIKSLIAEKNSYYSRNFMPNGDFTSVAITGMMTGLPDVNIHVNYQPKTYDEIYISAPAPPLKKLGYKVDFWYGGMPGWENISKMAIAQDFDNFYGFPDLNAPKLTTWGVKDDDLFNAIEKHLANEPPTVHFIMTTTNHPPYKLDLAAEGFDFEKTLAEIKKLPNVPNAETLAVELGHYWYMDKVITKFIRSVSEKYPNSLFIVTGDHAVRVDPGTHPTIFEHQSVPFVMYGAGISEKILPPDVVGGHTSIVPTIIELIAPEGFKYYSIAPSLFESFGVAFNRDVFITENVAGKIESDVVEILPQVASADLDTVNLSQERANAEKIISAVRTVTSWILKHDLNFEVK
ncbi:MAG: sulfatase-like hydrolase/transferase [Selenomonadaceae bacterium]|nr:sulfatase-like hydrolase/transferase [Selenomonadaceae bacterium]